MNVRSLFFKSDVLGITFSIKGKIFFVEILNKMANRMFSPIKGWYDSEYIARWIENYIMEHHDLGLIYSYGVGPKGDENNIESVVEELYEYFLSDCLDNIEEEQTEPKHRIVRECMCAMNLSD